MDKKEKPLSKRTKAELLEIVNIILQNSLSSLEGKTESEIIENVVILLQDSLSSLDKTKLEFLEKKLSQLEKKIYSHHKTLQEIKTTKQELEDLYENHKEHFDNKKPWFEGETITNDEGEEEKIKGIKNELEVPYKNYKERLDNYKERLDDIDRKIERAGASVEFIKSFEDKAKEHKDNNISFFRYFIWTILAAIVVIFIVGLITSGNIFSVINLYLLYPLILSVSGFTIWLLLFFSNRSGESKKLEEIYKHKEVMARAFIGYRKILEETPLDPQGDRNLLDGLMHNLLESLKQNPSNFIKSKSDYPPRYVLRFRTREEMIKEINKMIKGILGNEEYREFLLGLTSNLSESSKQTSEETKDSSDKKRKNSSKKKTKGSSGSKK